MVEHFEDEGVTCTAFADFSCVASGDIQKVVAAVKRKFGDDDAPPVLLFDDASGEQFEIDFRGSVADVLKRLKGKAEVGSDTEPMASGPGRPRLGVVAREVTLLPRHWAWLGARPGGASAALRKLVEAAKRASEGEDRIRRSQEATYRFMVAIAGNLPGFEEATRALFAKNSTQFRKRIRGWPKDVRKHVARLAVGAFG